MSQAQQGSTYDIPGPARNKSELFINIFGGNPADVSYKLEFEPSSPGKFLVNTETGEMLAQPTITGDFSTTLVAVDKSGAEAVVKSWSYSVNPKPVFTTSPGWDPDNEMTETIQQLTVDFKAFSLEDNQERNCEFVKSDRNVDNPPPPI